MGLYQRTMQRFGHTKTFRAMFKHTLPRIDRFLVKVSGGRINFASTLVPTFVLVHTGAKTGQERRTPLSFVTTPTGYALAASNWGQTHHPAWASNLAAHPDVHVIHKGETIAVRARRASEDEKAALWPDFVAMWPAYNTYVERSGRNIKVFLLDRIKRDSV